MAHYIDKDDLVSEIENLENTYKKCPTRNPYEEGLKVGRLIGYKDTLHKINILEVKKVDLEKELNTEWSKCNPIDEGMGCEFANISIEQFGEIAKHFFELGLRLNNEKEKRYEI